MSDMVTVTDKSGTHAPVKVYPEDVAKTLRAWFPEADEDTRDVIDDLHSSFTRQEWVDWQTVTSLSEALGVDIDGEIEGV